MPTYHNNCPPLFNKKEAKIDNNKIKRAPRAIFKAIPPCQKRNKNYLNQKEKRNNYYHINLKIIKTIYRSLYYIFNNLTN